jgi:hypothetical protein
VADNTTINAGTGGDVIATDDLTSLNGGVVSGVKVQRLKVGYGSDGSLRDVDGSNGLPIANVDGAVTASLSATDALGGTPAVAGVVIATAPTAGSFVALALPAGSSQCDVQIRGTATGTYYFEQSMNSTNGSDGDWIVTNFRQTGIVNTILGYSFTTAGVFRGNSAGFTYVRVRNVGGTSPTNQIIIRASAGSGTTFLNASLPAGTNQIGSVLNKVAGLTLSTGTITTATSTVTATTDIPNAGSVTVVVAGTYAGVNVTFEGSLDGTTWVGILAQRTDSYVIETASGVLPANTTRAWDVPLPGFSQFRVRATAWTSGTAAVGIAPAVNPFEIAPTVGLAPVYAAALSSVTAAITSTSLLAANPARRGVQLHNNSTSVLYLAYAATATATAYTVYVPSMGTWEMPQPIYTGALTGIWVAANGSAKITETS